MIETRLKDLRKESSYSQEDVANYLNVTQATYCDYENGKIKIPVEAFIKLADFYGTSLDYIVKRTNNSKAYPLKKQREA